MPRSRRDNTLLLALSVVLVCVTLLCFAQVHHHAFIGFDDDEYVTENHQVRSGLTLQGIVWAFTTNRAANWHPLTWLSHMVDCQLYGLNAGWHHVTNLFLHLASAVLLFLVLTRMTGKFWQSGFVAALFAIHPLHVESVAWVAERKDVLSTLFWVLTMWAYVRYVEKSGRVVEWSSGRGKGDLRCGTRRIYFLVLIFYTLGLMSKPMLVTLPFVLLLLDYWPLGRLNFGQSKRSRLPLLLEKLPLFCLSAVSSMVTLIVQQSAGAVQSGEILPMKIRVANGLVAYVAYLGKTLWPDNLAVFYPYFIDVPLWQPAGALLLLVVITTGVLWKGRAYPYLPVGWFWYLGTLVPVIGLVQVGSQAMADRYTYVPLIGPFIIVAMGVPDLLSRWAHRGVTIATGGAVLAALIIVTHTQVGYWRDSITLFNHALAVTTNNHLVHNNLGVALEKQGRLDEALVHYQESLRIRSRSPDAHRVVGHALTQQGRTDEALAYLSQALRLKPDFAEGHNSLGRLLEQEGKYEEALAEYNRAVRLKPDYVEARHNLGTVLERLGRTNEAMAHYSEAVQRDPYAAVTVFILANALATKGRTEEAITQYRRALQLKPDYPEAYNNLGNLVERLGKYDEAISYYKEALRLKPHYAEAENNWGVACAKQGRVAEAVLHFEKAISLDPSYYRAHHNLGTAMINQGRVREAIACFTEAVRLNPSFAEPLFSLGAAYAAVGDQTAAVKQYETLRTLNPDMAERLLTKIPR